MEIKTEVRITIKGQEIVLSLDEVKELKCELDSLLGKKTDSNTFPGLNPYNPFNPVYGDQGFWTGSIPEVAPRVSLEDTSRSNICIDPNWISR